MKIIYRFVVAATKQQQQKPYLCVCICMMMLFVWMLSFEDVCLPKKYIFDQWNSHTHTQVFGKCIEGEWEKIIEWKAVAKKKNKKEKHIYRVKIILKSGNVCDKHIFLFLRFSLPLFHTSVFDSFLYRLPFLYAATLENSPNVSRKIIEFWKCHTHIKKKKNVYNMHYWIGKSYV